MFEMILATLLINLNKCILKMFDILIGNMGEI